MHGEEAHIRELGSEWGLGRDLFRRAGPQTYFPIIFTCSAPIFPGIRPRFLFGIAACCTFALRNLPVFLNRTLAAAYGLVVIA
jgi:hypothetical protein